MLLLRAAIECIDFKYFKLSAKSLLYDLFILIMRFSSQLANQILDVNQIILLFSASVCISCDDCDCQFCVNYIK